MSFNKNGLVDFETLDEVAPYYYMKTKMLDDGSVWGRIHWLDVSTDTTCFSNASEVAECLNQANRFSLMGKIDYFRAAGMLPNGYTKLDYIQSTGTQYIDTGYHWEHEKTKIEANVLVTSNSAAQSLWGSEEYTTSSGNTRNFAHIFYGTNGSYSVYLGSGSQGTVALTLNKRAKVSINTTADKLLTVKVNNTAILNNKTYSGSVLTKHTAYTSSTASTTVGNIFIFSNHNSNRGSNNGPTQNVGGMRLYSFKMWDNDVMVRNFIPCKNASGTVGLWDTITQTFFTTPTGAFTAGTELKGLSIPQSGNFEFMLTYPKNSDIMYNRWTQTVSPHTAHSTSTTGTGYTAIKTDYASYTGPLRFTTTSSNYNNNAMYTANAKQSWWAPIGQYVIYNGGIPAADGSIQKETELWVRLDKLHPSTIKLITSKDFYIIEEESKNARIVEEKELHSTIFIES